MTIKATKTFTTYKKWDIYLLVNGQYRIWLSKLRFDSLREAKDYIDKSRS